MLPKLLFKEKNRDESYDPERNIERNDAEKVVENMRAVVTERACEKVLLNDFTA